MKNIAALQPAEFCGLAKILGVPLVRQEGLPQLPPEQIEKLGLEEETEYIAEFARPADLVLEGMMDKFLGLSKRRRKEICQILKDAKRGR